MNGTSEKLWEFPVVVPTAFTYFSVIIVGKVMMHQAICHSWRDTIAVSDYCLVERAQWTWRWVANSYLQQTALTATWQQPSKKLQLLYVLGSEFGFCTTFFYKKYCVVAFSINQWILTSGLRTLGCFQGGQDVIPRALEFTSFRKKFCLAATAWFLWNFIYNNNRR